LSAVGQLGFDEGGVVVFDGQADGGLVGQEGLDDDAAGFFGAAGTAGDLADELEGAFVGAEVGQGQGGVGADDADEGDVGKVQALGEDLGAGEDVDAAGGKIGQDPVVAFGAAGLHGVAVDAEDAGVGQEAGDLFGETLGADAEHGHVAVAEGAFGGDEGFAEAIVADGQAAGECLGGEGGEWIVGRGGAGGRRGASAVGAFVEGQGHIALAATEGVMAAWAEDEAAVAAAVQEEDGLFVAVEGFAEGLFEGAADDAGLVWGVPVVCGGGAGVGGRFGGHVDQVHGGQGSVEDAAG